jgi:DNA invertase Pin-like site-specific DNA recombinase
VRISTDDQSLDVQRDALVRAGCESVFEDRGVWGATTKRIGLDAALARVQAGTFSSSGNSTGLGSRFLT